MATTTSRLSLRKPDPSDTVNVETDLNDNYDAIDTHMGFERRTDFPATPFTGKTVMRSDQGDRCYIYDGSTWEEVLVRSAIMGAQQAFSGTDVNTTSTSYTSLSPAVELTFVCPPSGAIFVTVSAHVEAVDPSTGFASYEIRETNSSGTVVHTATDDVKAVVCQSDHFIGASTRSMIGSPMVPGNTYYIRVMCRASANTASFFYRGLLIEPVLN